MFDKDSTAYYSHVVFLVYFKHELVLMLKQAGFNDISVHGDFTEEIATPDHGTLVFIAKKEA